MRKKATGRHYKANNEGGFGNPPVRTQFGAGNVGGPGRRPRTITFEAAMAKMLAGTVAANIGGKPIEISMAEALAANAQKLMLSDKPASIEMGIRLMTQYGPKQESTDMLVFSWTEISLPNKRLLRDILKTMRKVDRREVFKIMRASKAVHEHERDNPPNNAL